ncbi:AAA family ATPase [Pontibacterium sp. N1Y112]|uniref:AAA family ATPase n=1 Tax=Pontibacterium sinense TaxID=2781979 RepID=A0A8J7JYN0_9GAMM|nr:division plane positioning ATPase MipZ [Pontibacterium sinense]MBE9397788.1 AAA family ATPase [Pontibacterium sinense]
MARGILIGGQKGGTGKSLVACNLATMISSQGMDVVLVDCDIQATSYKFWSRRSEKDFDCILERHDVFDIAKFEDTLQQCRINYDVLVVDVGGQDSKHLRAALACDAIDVLLSPIQPSFSDIETLVHLDNLVESAIQFNTELDTYCLVNRCHYNHNVTSRKSALGFIDKHCKNLKSFDQTLTDLIAYRQAFGKGQSVIEFEDVRNGSKRCSAEMQLLYKCLTGRNYKVMT